MDEGGQVTLAEGWIPTEESMIAFIESIQKHRPDLKRFNLSILVRRETEGYLPMFWADPSECKEIFQFDFIAPDHQQLDGNDVRVTSVQAGSQGVSEATDANDLDPVKSASRFEPKHNIAINHSFIQVLYRDMLENELARDLDDSDDFKDDLDVYDEYATDGES